VAEAGRALAGALSAVLSALGAGSPLTIGRISTLMDALATLAGDESPPEALADPDPVVTAAIDQAHAAARHAATAAEALIDALAGAE
jgi:hypothetical protein